MKKSLFALVLILLVSVLVSCSENPGTTTMKLILSVGVQEDGRTVLPSDSTVLDVVRYTISGTGPNGKKFTRNSESSSVEIEGLVVGQWNVVAKGLNKDGTELVSGSATVNLTATMSPQTIVLDSLVGSGSFSFVFDWSLCSISDPSLSVSIQGPDAGGPESSLTVTINREARTGTVSETLASGSYLMRAILRDGSSEVAGVVEAVRISNEASTSGSYTFMADDTGAASLTVSDSTGIPVRGSLSISGNPATLNNGSGYTCVFSFADPAAVQTNGMTIEWYYDGKLISSSPIDSGGSSMTFQAEYGVHRLDAVVSNKDLGSTGSASYTFTVAPTGETGEMVLLNANSGSGISGVDSETMLAALPGDMFLVVCPNSARIYVCSVQSLSLQVVRTYDSNNFAWLGRTKHVFSDPEMNYVIFTDNYGGHESFTCMRFNPASGALEEIAGMRYEGSVPSYGIPFTNFTAASFSPMSGIIYLADSGIALDYYLKESGNTLIMGGNYQKRGGDYNTVSDMDFSLDGARNVASSPLSNKFISGTVSAAGGPLQLYESEPASAAISHIKYVNSQTVVAASSNGFSTFRVVPGGVYTKYKDFNVAVRDMARDRFGYLYVADGSKNLISYSASGYELTRLGFTTLEDQILRIALADGHLVALTTGNRLALFIKIE